MRYRLVDIPIASYYMHIIGMAPYYHLLIKQQTYHTHDPILLWYLTPQFWYP